MPYSSHLRTPSSTAKNSVAQTPVASAAPIVYTSHVLQSFLRLFSILLVFLLHVKTLLSLQELVISSSQQLILIIFQQPLGSIQLIIESRFYTTQKRSTKTKPQSNILHAPSQKLGSSLSRLINQSRYWYNRLS